MKRLIDIVKLSRLDSLIRRAATGSPEELARRLDMSRSSLFELISYLKEEMGAPIIYNRNRPSYMYSYTPKFFLSFERDNLKSSEMISTHGGSAVEKIESKSHQEIEEEADFFVLDEDIDFNSLYH